MLRNRISHEQTKVTASHFGHSHPPLLFWFLGSLEKERKRSDIVIIQPAGDCLHDRIGQRFRAVSLQYLHEARLTQSEDVWNGGAACRGPVEGYEFRRKVTG